MRLLGGETLPLFVYLPRAVVLGTSDGMKSAFLATNKGQGYATRTSARSTVAVTPAIMSEMPLLMAAISCALSNFAERM
jgi:hypothetical protein